MSVTRTALAISKESHPKLYYFLRHHPEILQIFHNIDQDEAIATGVQLAQSDAPDIVALYIENLHIPLLVESKAIKKNPTRKCGYETLVSGLHFRDYDSSYTAKVAADRAVAIARRAKPKDNVENSLYCYYHGSKESVRLSSDLLAAIRKLIVDYAGKSSNSCEAGDASEGNRFDLVISARITRHEEL